MTQMEPQLSLGLEACPSENMSLKSGDCSVITCSQDHAPLKNPAKKQTRQWAAWTHQEEENFFAALRQVGKNFEKITCRVQSKNKDQVRHYYYRLVRRMNKFLGPELCLDAKNSKETNAAMLRWWSLLEKYSCKASKLHLKPRRFKMFIETLEYQLLRDRKKRIRKRPSNGGSCPTAGPATLSNQGRASGHANHSVEVVLLDSQNIQKLGSGKGSSFRRDANIGLARSNIKADLSSVKQARQRRKPGNVSTAAYKKWEKAAIAGVSLVADAAEHLERVACDKVFEHSQGTPGLEVLGKDGSSLPTSQNLLIENNAQTSMKLKLQLFPFDESTRKALEMDNHNPHLELTLSGRKKISSVLEHLNRKWGNSSIASGEIMLLPYCIQRDNLVGCQKWSQDSVLSAADVYVLIGSPPIFRLRYGWFSNSKPRTAISQASSSTLLVDHTEQIADKEKQNGCLISLSPQHGDHNCDNIGDQNKDLQVFLNKASPVVLSSADVSGKINNPNTDLLNSSNHVHDNAWNRRETGNEAVISQIDDVDDRRLRNGTSFSAGDWADSLTNISVGDLLSEVSHNIDANYVDQPPPGSQYLQQMPFSCDSFDAAIAAHIFKHQNKTGCQPALASHGSSIWDAEVTCDAFSFQKNIVICENVRNASGSTSLEACKQIGESSRALSVTSVEELPEAEEPMDDDPADEDQMDVSQTDPHDMDDTAKDLNGLTDIYWPDSLGPLDLDIPSCKYHTDNLILSDSLSGLNRLIASSLDAFQNCSFFGLDNKEASSTVEARESISFSDYKIGSEV